MASAKTTAKQPASARSKTATSSKTTARSKTTTSSKKTAATAKQTALTPKATSASSKKPASTRVSIVTPGAKKPAAPRIAIVKPLGQASTTKPALAPRAGAVHIARTAPTPEQRHKMIEQAAYFLAEKDAFMGHSLDYWISAEVQINTLLGRARR